MVSLPHLVYMVVESMAITSQRAISHPMKSVYFCLGL
ncbi:hypothetical protein SP_1138 [Streptococcus pneumoniae TIGR4]|uniref:Uncharacterized protein n=1 Tax=Streptococcus pneumoniae serotype 4 (strain ATCC BAA-334 / TIGR4) TaxID=170187 RepID=A0A0H2UQ03_STRPN|nr:hypothetical protein SP_1138 [Streptococcus pneumoniae TIGR4]